MNNLYYMDPDSGRIQKVREGLDDDGRAVYMGVPVKNSTTVIVVRLPVVHGFLSTPIEVETGEQIRLTVAQWENAYRLKGWTVPD